MPLQTVRLNPGVSTQQTQLLNQTSWFASQCIRFFQGLVQKLGGWVHLNSTPIIGTGRAMHGWSDLSSNPYIAVGTEQRLEVFENGSLYDITPIRQTDNVAVNFSTVINTPTVTIIDATNGASATDWVNINVPVAVGGLVLQGPYQVQSIIDANTYTITAPSNATATVNNGGAVPLYSTTNTSATVKVTLANHGYTVGNLYANQVATTVGGLTLAAYSDYNVTTLIDANNFDITAAATATSTTTGHENGGDAQLIYLIASGLASNTAESGYGTGPYGDGVYGIGGGGSIIAPLRLWFLDNWGQDLVGNYTGSTLYFWTPPYASGMPALPITGTDVPQTVNGSLVAQSYQIFIVFGSDPVGGGNLDPNLIRWSDVADFTDWLATSANQAGSFRIPTGSEIVGMLKGPQFILIWTDVDVWLMQYIGYPLVFGFEKIAGGCELIAPHAAGNYMSAVYWLSPEQAYVFDGTSVQVVPCTVYDIFFRNLDIAQKEKVWCWVNSVYNEVWWFYPSVNGTGECDSYIKYNVQDQVWDYGSMIRTCGIDTNPYGYPVAMDTSGLLQQHEGSVDADGQPMVSSVTTGWFDISDGSYFTMIERLIGDFVLNNGTQGEAAGSPVYVTITMQNYPTDPEQTYGPFPWTPGGPPYSIVRGRGRVASVTISSTGTGVFWRLGALRYLGAPAGRR